MIRTAWYTYAAMSVTIGVLSMGGIAPPPTAHPPPALSSSPTIQPPLSGGAPVSVYANLTINASSVPGLYAFSPNTLTLPSLVPIVLTISNFDPRPGPVASPQTAEVIGATWGTEVVHQGTYVYATHFLPMNQVGHTFTVRTPQFFLNVPIPPDYTPNLPTTVTVTFVLPAPGTYPFYCAVLTSIGQGGLQGLISAT